MPERLRCLQSAHSDQAKLFEILVGELVDFVIFLIDPDGCIVSWNLGVEKVLGYTEAEWVGTPVARIFTPEDVLHDLPGQEMQIARDTGRASDVRWHLRKNGERLFVEGTMVALRNDSGDLLGFSKVMRDITERHRREQQSEFLLRMEDALRPLVDPAEMMSTAAEMLGAYLGVDRCTYSDVGPDEEAVEILWNYTRPGIKNITGRCQLSDFGAAVAHELRCNRPVVLADAESDPNLSDVRTTYQQLEIYSHISVPLHKAGKLVAVMAVHQRERRVWTPFEIQLVRFVTDRCWEAVERARLTRVLRENEIRYRTLFESIDDGYCIIEVLFTADGKPFDYRFVDVNPAFEKHSGLAGVVGKTVREMLPNHEQYWFDIYGAVVTTGQPTRFIDQAEAVGRWFDVYAFRLGLPDEHQVAVLFRDVTAKKSADAERESLLQLISTERGRLQQVFLQAPVAVIVLRGRDFVVELANPSYQALLSGRELLGRRFADVIPEVGPHVWKALHYVFDSGKPFVAEDWHVPYDFNQDGKSEDHWFNVAYTPLREADGRISGVIGVLTEVTAQVLAHQELERTNVELSRLNRSLEEFAYAASHDLQEPLRTVNAYSELLVRTVGKNPENQNLYAGFVRQGVGRMQELIRDLLTFARMSHSGDEPVGIADVSAALSEAKSVLEKQISESNGTVRATALPLARGNTRQLTHVFQNLIANSLKYRSPDVAPQITVAAVREHSNWIISVRDNGIGFEPQYAQQIFGLFKRLHKDEYPGTGVGLAICQRMVERFGGRIWAESEPGKGATFSFSLPAETSLEPTHEI